MDREKRKVAGERLFEILESGGKAIAHRGGHRGSPIEDRTFGNQVANSAPAFDNAIRIAGKHERRAIVEFDTMLTMDGVIALYNFDPESGKLPDGWEKAFFIRHSDPKPQDGVPKEEQKLFWLGLTTDSDDFAYNLTSDEFSRLRLGIAQADGTISFDYDGPQILNPISLVDFLREFILKKDVSAEIEIQPFAFHSYNEKNHHIAGSPLALKEGAFIARIVDEVVGIAGRERLMFLTSVPEVANGIHSVIDDIPIEYLILPKRLLAKEFSYLPPERQLYIPDNIENLKRSGVIALHTMSSEGVTEEWLKSVRKEGLHVIVGGCNDPDEIEGLFNIGVAAIGADNYEPALEISKNLKIKAGFNATKKRAQRASRLLP